jgi:undecaprenyl diphosphate synthase
MLLNIPKHVGVIMDGNGRWARVRGLPRVEGHKRGAERTKDIIKAAQEVGIEVLTFYAFSSENWQRPLDEISSLMQLLFEYLSTELHDMIKEGIRFKAIGDLEKLPVDIQRLIAKTEELTAECLGYTIVLALSYGGRDEIIRAVKRALSLSTKPDDLGEQQMEMFLDTAGLPPVDLVIRTSGEKRLSNFLIWQAAYAELYFTETLWPDFTKEEFLFAIQDYQRRERRFGAVLPNVRSS